jgi:hypothetical protein
MHCIYESAWMPWCLRMTMQGHPDSANLPVFNLPRKFPIRVSGEALQYFGHQHHWDGKIFFPSNRIFLVPPHNNLTLNDGPVTSKPLCRIATPILAAGPRTTYPGRAALLDRRSVWRPQAPDPLACEIFGDPLCWVSPTIIDGCSVTSCFVFYLLYLDISTSTKDCK